jgi:hypothetical protein
VNEPHFLVPASLIAGIMAYLKKRPYEEVAGAIGALMQVREFSPEPAEGSINEGKTDEKAN